MLVLSGVLGLLVIGLVLLIGTATETLLSRELDVRSVDESIPTS